MYVHVFDYSKLSMLLQMAKFKKSVCNSLMAADDYVLGLLQNTSAIYRLVLRIGDPVI